MERSAAWTFIADNTGRVCVGGIDSAARFQRRSVAPFHAPGANGAVDRGADGARGRLRRAALLHLVPVHIRVAPADSPCGRTNARRLFPAAVACDVGMVSDTRLDLAGFSEDASDVAHIV